MTFEPSVLFHLAVCALFLAVLGEASLKKLWERETPSWFVAQFAGTWLGRLPAAPQWWGIAFAELAVAGLFATSVLTGEPWSATRPLLEYGLVGAGFVFSALCFGLRVAGDFGGAASGFNYAALSLLLWAAVRLALVVPG